MKAKVYLRVAKGVGRKGFKVEASPEPNFMPISTQGYRGGTDFHPTISFAMEFDIPDEMFKAAEQTIAQVNLAAKETQIEGAILFPAIKKVAREMEKAKNSKKQK